MLLVIQCSRFLTLLHNVLESLSGIEKIPWLFRIWSWRNHRTHHTLDGMEIWQAKSWRKYVVILWYMPIHNDKEIIANRFDIVSNDRKKIICIFIEMSVPSKRSVVNKETKIVSIPRSYQNIEHGNFYYSCNWRSPERH